MDRLDSWPSFKKNSCDRGQIEGRGRQRTDYEKNERYLQFNVGILDNTEALTGVGRRRCRRQETSSLVKSYDRCTSFSDAKPTINARKHTFASFECNQLTRVAIGYSSKFYSRKNKHLNFESQLLAMAIYPRSLSNNE